jgi:hypothetical protein
VGIVHYSARSVTFDSHNHINYSQRTVTVTAGGQVVYNKEISNEISQKARTGDFKDGSQYGTGRTYTLNVDVRPATRPTGGR